jgi:hypothetical protein
MKTAVQLFCEELERQMSIETFQLYKDFKEKCLELEKKQIIRAFDEGLGCLSSGEDYYKETYKQ